MSENNDINAIRLCLVKATASTGCRKHGTSSSVKTVTIDLPCSRNVFTEHFVSKVELIKYCGEDNYKCTVTASNLNEVFGENWDSFIYSGTGTKRRIIGLIVLHNRLKALANVANGVSR